MPINPHLVNLVGNPEKAREMALKSAESKRRTKTMLASQQIVIDRLGDEIQALKQANAQALPAQRLDEPLPDDERLMRLRSQIDKVDEALDRELLKPVPLPKVVSELARAKATLAELERRMAGRPLPPTVRANGNRMRENISRPPPTPIA